MKQATVTCDKKANIKLHRSVPKRRLAKGVTLGMEIGHDILKVGRAQLDVLEQRNEDILMSLGVPGLKLTSGVGHLGSRRSDNDKRIRAVAYSRKTV